MGTLVSFSIGHQTNPQPNLYGLFLIFLGFISTALTQNQKIRISILLISIFFAVIRLWLFASDDIYNPEVYQWWLNNGLSDEIINLPLNYAIGAAAFLLFQVFEEIHSTSRHLRLWTSVAAILIFSFISIGVLRIFFKNGEGFSLYGLARVQPYDAFFLQLFMSYHIFKSWHALYRHWELFRVSLAISAIGGIFLAIVATGIERQIYTVVQSQLEKKVTDIKSALMQSVHDRLSVISIFGDFLNTVSEPSEGQIYAMLSRLDSSGMESPDVFYLNQNYELKWLFKNNKLQSSATTLLELPEKHKALMTSLEAVKLGNKFFRQKSALGHSISFSRKIIKNNKIKGYLVFEDLIENQIKSFFFKNDYGPFYINIQSMDGASLFTTVPFLKPAAELDAKIDFLGEPLKLTVYPSQEFSINTMFIPLFSFLSIGLLIVIVLIYAIYINRKRVHDVEKEVQDRIQDMKILKEEADKAKLVAEHASYSKSQFLANMSHEIRTPLNILLGSSELLSETHLSQEQKNFVQMFQNSGKHLLGLLNDIIDLSRIESGQLETEKISFDLAKNMDFIQNLFYLKTQEQGLEFIVNTQDVKNPIRLGDPLRIRQILVNLIGNSLKFTQKGTIRLTVREVDQNDVQFVVEDTGAGIPSSKQKEIFESFQQGDVSFSRKHGGAGLGLAITRNLCELMKGRIELYSRPNAGSKFIVQIPLEKTTLDPAKDEDFDAFEQVVNEKNTSVHFQIKTLLVDDSDDNRFLIKLFLNHSQFEIVEAKNGQEALDFFKLKSFNIVLMDMQMPVMDGYEAVKKIREYEEIEGKKTKVPILALTAHGTSLEKTRCLEIGCNEYLSKPVSKNVLIKRIAELIQSSHYL